MEYKPYHLPQLSAPYLYIVDQLAKEDIDCDFRMLGTEELHTCQNVVVIKANNFPKIKPIWVSSDNYIIDGHHRYVISKLNNMDIPCYRLSVPKEKAIRILNKIQDIYDHEDNKLHDIIKDNIMLDFKNDPNDMPFKALENVKMRLYRNSPLKEDSTIGNFFTTVKSPDCDAYDVEFDYLMDCSEYGDGKMGINEIFQHWFSNIEIDKISDLFNLNDRLKYRLVANKAKMLGFDGIKISNKLVLGFFN